MTVLLIDASGHKRQYEIPRWMPVILIPLPQPVRRWLEVRDPPQFEPLQVAEFWYSDEPSYPPVYRQRLKMADCSRTPPEERQP